jgi:hypothetical protein
MLSSVVKFSKTLVVFILCVFANISLLAADDLCPNGADPIYCKIAQETDGKAYNSDSKNILKNVLEDNKKSIEQSQLNNKPVHKYALYSSDIGCSEVDDARGRQICDSISKNLEWSWSGYATISVGQRPSWDTIKNVYCDDNITKSDLPVLAKMCGTEITPYMYCVKPSDWRLASGVEYLIKTIISLNGAPEELKGSVYDPKSNDYLLKGGCKK